MNIARIFHITSGVSPVTDTIRYGTAVLDGSKFGDPYIYIYGEQGDPTILNGMKAIVARVAPVNIRNLSVWEFWAGSFGWLGSVQGCDFRSSFPISEPAGSSGIVAQAIDPAHQGQFMMINIQSIIAQVAISYAPKLWGPFNTWQWVYYPFEDPYPAAGYAPKLHPDLSNIGELIFTFIPFVWASSEHNTDVCNARFVRMRIID